MQPIRVYTAGQTAADKTRHCSLALASGGGCTRMLGVKPLCCIERLEKRGCEMERSCLAVCMHCTPYKALLFVQIYSCKWAFLESDNILSHARGQGGRGNLGEEGRGEARLQAAAAAAGCTRTPHGTDQPPFHWQVTFANIVKVVKREFSTVSLNAHINDNLGPTICSDNWIIYLCEIRRREKGLSPLPVRDDIICV